MNNHEENSAVTPEYLDYHYRELVRLSEIQNNHTNNAFSDFKLLGVVGTMLAWKPLSEALLSNTQTWILPIGFVTILFVVLLTTLLNFMRQSIVLYYTEQVKHHEAAIRKALRLVDEQSFAAAKNWRQWSKEIHEPIAWRFFIYLYLLLIAFPTSILLVSEQTVFGLSYLGIAVTLIAIHACVTTTIIRQVNLSTV